MAHDIVTSDTREALDTAKTLEAAGRPIEAIEALVQANRRHRAPEIENHLVTLRHRAYRATVPSRSTPLPPRVTASAHAAGPLPELTPADLSVATLRDGFARNGCVLVRGLIPPGRATELAAGIDTALDAFDADGSPSAEFRDESWYTHFTPAADGYRVGGRRNWVRATGAMWTADSPRMLFELLETIDQTGIGALVSEYLGERPVLSANKCTLRRVPIDTNSSWHQDGAFLGEEVRTVNLWLALGHCGIDAPGLDVVPRRFDHVVETGTEGAYFDWDVGPGVVEAEAAEAGVIRPEFGPGDALLFDHLLLHRTAVTPTMTKERHAMETWFFAPSSYPSGQIPLVY